MIHHESHLYGQPSLLRYFLGKIMVASIFPSALYTENEKKKKKSHQIIKISTSGNHWLPEERMTSEVNSSKSTKSSN